MKFNAVALGVVVGRALPVQVFELEAVAKDLGDEFGFDLISSRGSVPVMVIDHVGLPTAN